MKGAEIAMLAIVGIVAIFAIMYATSYFVYVPIIGGPEDKSGGGGGDAGSK